MVEDLPTSSALRWAPVELCVDLSESLAPLSLESRIQTFLVKVCSDNYYRNLTYPFGRDAKEVRDAEKLGSVFALELQVTR